MDLSVIRAEIEHMRRQIRRQRKEIQYLQRAGISTTSAEKLLGRMQSKVDGLCAERDRLMGEEQRRKVSWHRFCLDDNGRCVGRRDDPRSSVMRIMDEIVFSGFARRTAASASDFARVVRDLILDVRDSYRPELPYMRG